MSVVGIIGALPEEISAIVEKMTIKNETVIAKRTFLEGTLFDQKVVVSLSRMGKVGAAITTTLLHTVFNVDKVIFTGVAGSAHPGVNVGDIVISKTLIQHDMDASPLATPHEIPLLGETEFKPDDQLEASATLSSNEYLKHGLSKDALPEILAKFGVTNPIVHVGTIASGDQFIKDADTLASIKSSVSTVHGEPVLCVEMEGAAVAQTCYELGIPFIVIRTISDNANHSAHIDFAAFIKDVACHYSFGIVSRMMIKS